MAARNLAAHCSKETPDQADTRQAQYQKSMASRPDCRRWQPEEKEMSACVRRPSCPGGGGGQETKSERQIAELVSVLFLLKLKSVISA